MQDISSLKPFIGAVILAAGQSQRMGKNKMCLQLGGKPIFKWVIENILDGGFSQKEICLVVSSHWDIRAQKEFKPFNNIHVVINDKAFMGQSTSLQAGIRFFYQTKGVFFFLGDQPFIHPEDIFKLRKVAKASNDSIVLPVEKDNFWGNPTFFPKKFYTSLMNVKGDKGGRDLIQNPQNKICKVTVEKSHIHFDLDTPEDYEKAKQIFPKWRGHSK